MKIGIEIGFTLTVKERVVFLFVGARILNFLREIAPENDR